MPTRILRDGILTSEGVCSLTWAAEVFYRRLMSVADDHGRFHALPKLLRAACYPLQIDKVSDADIGKWITECVTAALVSVYPAADGKRYIQILKFGQQVRAKSKFPEPSDNTLSTVPAPASNCLQPPADVHLGGVVFGVEDEGGGVPARKRAARSPKTSMPEDFTVSPRVQEWAKDKGFDRLSEHLEAFRAKVKAKGYTYADWDSAFMEAIREDWAKLRGRTPNGAAPPPERQESGSTAAEETAQRIAERRAIVPDKPPAAVLELAQRMRAQA